MTRRFNFVRRYINFTFKAIQDMLLMWPEVADYSNMLIETGRRLIVLGTRGLAQEVIAAADQPDTSISLASPDTRSSK